MELILKPQEESTGAKFDGQFVMSRGFLLRFGEKAFALAIQALTMVRQQRVPTGADYLQAFLFEDESFWLIDDGDVVTALLPSDY